MLEDLENTPQVNFQKTLAMSIDGMNNRIKSNLSLKNKSNKYRKAAFKQMGKWNKRFQFKTPTEEDLLKTKKSNQEYAKYLKKRNSILLIISFLIKVVVFFLFF